MDDLLGTLVVHFKGEMYRVNAIAKDVSNGADLTTRYVVYQRHDYDRVPGEFHLPDVFIRKLDEFLGNVEVEENGKTKVVPRFRRATMDDIF
jgi:hypothetical protein